MGTRCQRNGHWLRTIICRVMALRCSQSRSCRLWQGGVAFGLKVTYWL